ncbi:MAG TPA: hypothetical protein VEB23_00025 [Ramlibacter sp.]|nr:hypothetical protein [Ramlibacter sp.]
MVDNPRAELELAVFGKVYELLLSHPIRSAFREADDGPEGEPPPTDPEMLVAVQADRFDLGVAVRELRRKAQRELFVGEFTDTARCALLWVLWHHQGGSSEVGQAMRFALGMGAHEHLTDEQVADAGRWAAIACGVRVPAEGRDA